MSLLVPAVSPMKRSAIEQDALQIIADLHPYLLDDPGPFPVIEFFDFDLVEEYGLMPGVARLSDGIEGMTFPDGRVLVSEETYRLAVAGNGRARYTLAHEAYHGIRHRLQIRCQLIHTGLVLYRRQAIPAYRDPEWQANVFASALLMPAPAVKVLAARQSDLRLLSALMAKTFGVSQRAAEVRLDTLGMAPTHAC